MPADELEAAINEVGRDRVFAMARALGWGDTTPPEFVWWSIVDKLRVCADCPPLGYSTDITRCDPCPRRAPHNYDDAVADLEKGRGDDSADDAG
jgi:hypothetical protein